jgi:hypothetical protein
MLHHLADCLRGYPHEIPPVGRSGTDTNIRYSTMVRSIVSMLWVRSGTAKYTVNVTRYQCYGFVRVEINISYNATRYRTNVKGRVFRYSQI